MARKTSNSLIDEQIMDQAFSELASLVEESEALLEGRSASAGSKHSRHQLRLLLCRGGRLAGQLRHRAAPALDGTRRYVSTHPLKAVGLAAVAGLFAALLVNRRD